MVRTFGRGSVWLALAALALWPVAGRVQEPPAQLDEQKVNEWMKMKLTRSQDILAGSTRGELDKVAKSAESIGFIRYFEKWAKSDKPEYKRQLEFFDIANKELVKQAKAKNLDGAALAYTQMTLVCVQCHKVVRDGGK